MAATVKCDTLQNASSATANITLDASGNATVGNTLVMGSSFLRNRIINGGIRADQRNSGATQTITAAAALAYTADRWYAYCTGANVTGQQVSNSGTAASPATNAYQFTGAASVTAIGFGQRIEAINCFDLANTTATLSVNLSNSVLTTVTWTAYYANTADTFGTLASPTVTQIATGTFTVNSTLTRYSTNISIPSAATTGIQILFTVGAQTSGTWVIGNVQLEAGPIATPFERRQYGTELMLCQRYYYRVSGVNNTPFGFGQVSTSTQVVVQTNFIVPMRIAPTALEQTGTASNYKLWQANSAAVSCTSVPIFNSSSVSSATSVATSSSLSGTAGQCSGFLTDGTGYLGWSAEL